MRTPATHHPTIAKALCLGLIIAGSALDARAQVCGTTVYDTGGPSGNYGNNENYVITYCPDNPGDILTFDITMWNLRSQDVLTIYNGPDIGAPVAATFTNGNGNPAPIASTHASGCITIQFTSNGSQVQAGWEALITCATPPPPPPACGTTVYDPGGAGGNYPNNANFVATYCPTNPGDVVTFDVTTLATQAGVDIIEVFDGPNVLAPLIGTLSGTGNPSPITSTHATGCITIRFTSNGSNTGAGWAANITCGPPPVPGSDCGSTIYDPGGSGNYANNANYTVTYCPDVPGEVVSLNFTVFATEANFDQLRIYNGNSAAAPLIGTYSGNGSPGTVTSTAANGCLTLVFTSDASITYAGWVASVVCAVPPPPPSGDCIYVLSLYDTWGDGWGTSNVTVCVDPSGPASQTCNTYTVTASFNQVVFGVGVGDLVTITYNNSGAFQGDNRYSLSNQAGGGALFNSGTPPAAGMAYAAVVDCIVPALPPEDCAGGVTVCNSLGLNNNTTNTGSVVDLNNSNYGCLLNAERQGTWYNFSPSSSGNVAFSIDPANMLDDYDFAIWGPYPAGSSLTTVCPPLGPPLRCSYAAPSGSTGLNYTATDNSEGAAGDKWVNDLTVTAGEVYLMYISNWSQSGLAFTLNWNLTNGASLDCTVLPMSLIGLHATALAGTVQLDWTTLSEEGTAGFTVERASEAGDFMPIGTLDAAGHSITPIDYRFMDRSPEQGVNRYRLLLADQDGTTHRSEEVHVYMQAAFSELHPFPDPAEQLLNVQLPAWHDATVQLLVFDAAGRMVRALPPRTAGEAQVIQLPLDGLDAGTYLLRLAGSDGSMIGSGRFVKM